MITTTKTPVTKTTWTETTSYEIGLDKLNIDGGKGVLKAEKSESGEVVYMLEVTPKGGIDINVEALIRELTSKSNLKEITDYVISTSEAIIENEESSGNDDNLTDTTNRNGSRYYLNPVSDGFQGRMFTGQHTIDGVSYRFEEKAGSEQGRLLQ